MPSMSTSLGIGGLGEFGEFGSVDVLHVIVATGKMRRKMRINIRILPTHALSLTGIFQALTSRIYLLIGGDRLVMNLCMFELYYRCHFVLVCSLFCY